MLDVGFRVARDRDSISYKGCRVDPGGCPPARHPFWYIIWSSHKQSLGKGHRWPSTPRPYKSSSRPTAPRSTCCSTPTSGLKNRFSCDQTFWMASRLLERPTTAARSRAACSARPSNSPRKLQCKRPGSISPCAPRSAGGFTSESTRKRSRSSGCRSPGTRPSKKL